MKKSTRKIANRAPSVAARISPMATADFRERFATRLYDRMVSMGLHQSELARLCGIPRDMVSVYMRGKALPSQKNLNRLAKALNCTPADLFDWRSENPARRVAVYEVANDPDLRRVVVNVDRMVSKETAAQIVALLGV